LFCLFLFVFVFVLFFFFSVSFASSSSTATAAASSMLVDDHADHDDIKPVINNNHTSSTSASTTTTTIIAPTTSYTKREADAMRAQLQHTMNARTGALEALLLLEAGRNLHQVRSCFFFFFFFLTFFFFFFFRRLLFTVHSSMPLRFTMHNVVFSLRSILFLFQNALWPRLNFSSIRVFSPLRPMSHQTTRAVLCSQMVPLVVQMVTVQAAVALTVAIWAAAIRNRPISVALLAVSRRVRALMRAFCCTSPAAAHRCVESAVAQGARGAAAQQDALGPSARGDELALHRRQQRAQVEDQDGQTVVARRFAILLRSAPRRSGDARATTSSG
jgi:hypothetical protein